MSTFAELWSAPERMPGFWSGPLGTRYRYALGGTLDQWLTIHWARLRSAWPSYATDASRPEIARDRRVQLFPGQSKTSQIQMLKRWRSAHREAGLPAGIARMQHALWTPAAPTIRIVHGNAQHAMWATLYGDDATAMADGATDEELDDGRTQTVTADDGKRYEIVVGRRPRFHLADPSNFDWDSAFPYGPAINTIHRYFVIVYAPDGVEPNLPLPPTSDVDSLGSPNITVQHGKNIASCARAWQRVGALLWGWILAFDPLSFSMTGSGADYPDGTWYRAYVPGVGFNRLQSARYYELQSTIVA